MATINSIASQIVNTLNQPNNRELLERVKDLVRNAFALKVKESIYKEGVREILTTSFSVSVSKIIYTDWIKTFKVEILTDDQKQSTNTYVSTKRIITPIDYQGDSPFTEVSRSNGNTIVHIPYTPRIGTSKFNTSSLAAVSKAYAIKNGYLVIDDGTTSEDTLDIYVSGIFENPASVLDPLKDEDNVVLPIPNSMIEDMIYTIFKINFNMYPKHIEVNVENLKDK